MFNDRQSSRCTTHPNRWLSEVEWYVTCIRLGGAAIQPPGPDVFSKGPGLRRPYGRGCRTRHSWRCEVPQWPFSAETTMSSSAARCEFRKKCPPGSTLCVVASVVISAHPARLEGGGAGVLVAGEGLERAGKRRADNRSPPLDQGEVGAQQGQHQRHQFVVFQDFRRSTTEPPDRLAQGGVR